MIRNLRYILNMYVPSSTFHHAINIYIFSCTIHVLIIRHLRYVCIKYVPSSISNHGMNIYDIYVYMIYIDIDQ